MAWYIMPWHGLAHIQPSYATNGGSDVTGYSLGNIRTLNPFTTARITPGSSGVQIEWDRGGNTTPGGLNCILIVGADYNYQSTDQAIESADDSGFTTNLTTLVEMNGSLDDLSAYTRWHLFSESTQRRYMRWYAPNATLDPHIFGTVSMGIAWQVATSGPQIRTEQLQSVELGRGPGRPIEGVERVTMSFRNVTRATADSILRYASVGHIHERDSGTEYIHGLGGGGGRYPIAVVDANSSGVADGRDIYFGRASLSVKAWAANYSEVFITLDRIPSPTS